MRVIKFRGRDVHTGEYVFGFYTTGSDDKSFIIINSAQGQYLREVKPDSVAQLVGYDTNGNEIYEGDTVAFFHEGDTLKGTRSEWTAVLVPDIVNEKIQDVRPAAFNRLTLKEGDQ